MNIQRINLKPIIDHERIDVLFVPLNPAPESNKNGHYFSREIGWGQDKKKKPNFGIFSMKLV